MMIGILYLRREREIIGRIENPLYCTLFGLLNKFVDLELSIAYTLLPLPKMSLFFEMIMVIKPC